MLPIEKFRRNLVEIFVNGFGLPGRSDGDLIPMDLPLILLLSLDTFHISSYLFFHKDFLPVLIERERIRLRELGRKNREKDR